MKKVKMGLPEFLEMGGKIENLSTIFDRYNSKHIDRVEYSHKTAPSFGNPAGVDIYIAWDRAGKPTELAGSWLEVEVQMVLQNQ